MENMADKNAALATPWLNLWNGDLALADELIAPDFLVHAAPLTGSGSDEMRGRDTLKQWIGGIRASLPDLRFSIEVGPIANEGFFSVRWRAEGTYAGGFPGASEGAVGRLIKFTGTDTLRIEAGRPSTGQTRTPSSLSSSWG